MGSTLEREKPRGNRLQSQGNGPGRGRTAHFQGVSGAAAGDDVRVPKSTTTIGNNFESAFLQLRREKFDGLSAPAVGPEGRRFFSLEAQTAQMSSY